MDTKQWDEDTIEEAYHQLAAGEIVALPTETVYGLGADATNDQAVQKIFQAKGRPSDNPLIIHVANKEQLQKYVASIPAYVDELMAHFSPGPITYVLPSNGSVAPAVSAGLPTVAVRIPEHPVAQKLLERCDFPVAAPSANLSGKPSPTTAAHVWEDLAGKVAGIIDGGNARSGLESTVVDCTGAVPIILRPGEITEEQIRSVLGKVTVSKTEEAVEKPKSPGMKYKHYAPAVPFYLYIGYSNQEIEEVIESAFARNKRVGLLILEEKYFPKEGLHIYVPGKTPKEIAHHLYDTLRSVSKADVDILIACISKEDLLTEAIMDRLTRAATEVYST